MEEEKELKDIKLGASLAYKGVIYECRLGLTCEDCVFDTGDSYPGCGKPLVLVLVPVRIDMTRET